MNKLKIIILLFVLLVFTYANAQKKKIENKDGVIIVDGKPYAKLVKSDGVGLSNHSFSIKNLSGTELIFFKKNQYQKWERDLFTNKMDSVRHIFYEVHFPGSGGVVRLPEQAVSEKGALKIAVENELIKDDAIDPDAEARYISINHGSVASKVSAPLPEAPKVYAPLAIADNPIGDGMVTIGKQSWMGKNLNVDRFANGDPIPEAKTAEEWIRAGENQQPAWCYYNNDTTNGRSYGRLYNGYAVKDPRGLAPRGQHIPSSYEWEELIYHTSSLIGLGVKYGGDDDKTGNLYGGAR